MRIMKKSFLTLTAGLFVLAGCTQNELDNKAGINDPVELKVASSTVSADAESRAPFEGAIGASNKLKALVLASTTNGDYSSTYASGAMEFIDDQPVEYATTDVDVSFTGNSYYPADDTELFMTGLYPATGWSAFNTTSTYTFTGKEDVMAAAQQSTKKSQVQAQVPVIPKLTFNHLLTKLEIKLKAEDVSAISAWGKINKIELVKAAGANPYTKLELTLASGQAPVTGFSLQATQMPSYQMSGTYDMSNVLTKSYTDDVYENMDYVLTAPASSSDPDYKPAYQSYILAAPVTATGTADYTLRVYAEKAKEGTAANKYIDVPVNLKKADSSAFTGSTQGHAFEVLLTFRSLNIQASAEVTPWLNGGESEEIIE